MSESKDPYSGNTAGFAAGTYSRVPGCEYVQHDDRRVHGDTRGRTAQNGENTLSPSDSAEGVGVLRLRRTIRFANPPAALRMTELIAGYQLMTAIRSCLPTLSGNLIGGGAVCEK
jgi:hypothetical protein